MKISALRKCLVWICAVLVSYSAVRPCSGASLVEISLNRLMGVGGTPRSDVAANTGRVLSADLSATELSQLSSHDVVLIIDKSHSMATTDCTPIPLYAQLDASSVGKRVKSHVSRWQWCREQARALTEKTKDAMPAGITVVLFSGDAVVYNNVNASAIETMFSDYKPNGSSNAVLALKSQLDQYFERKGRSGQHAKPLLIAVITDGCPNDSSKLRYTIIDATQHMTTPNEIAITFLQIGNDPGGSKLLNGLDNNLVAQKAQFDIVDVKPFAQLRETGLARALVSAIASK